MRIDFEFVFKRPCSHFNKKGLTKKAPTFPSKSDVDNCMKSCIDALNKVAYQDDAQVVEGCFTRGYSDSPTATGHTRLIITNA